MSPFEFIDQNAWMLQVVLVVLSMVFAFLVAALQPTFTRAIANVVFAFLAYFVGCGLVVCPYAMPMMLPDKTGTVALIWQISGYAVKCVVVIAIAVRGADFSFCFLPAPAPVGLAGHLAGSLAGLALGISRLCYISRRLFLCG